MGNSCEFLRKDKDKLIISIVLLRILLYETTCLFPVFFFTNTDTYTDYDFETKAIASFLLLIITPIVIFLYYLFQVIANRIILKDNAIEIEYFRFIFSLRKISIKVDDVRYKYNKYSRSMKLDIGIGKYIYLGKYSNKFWDKETIEKLADKLIELKRN